LTSYRDQLSEDPQKVLNEIGIAPVAQGEASGYRIAGEVPEQVLNQAGLQRGDVVLSVNGTPVGNVGNDQALIDQALAAGRVRVEIQRNDRKFYLTVPIP
jgi:general secretion pathway protein C